MAEPTPAPAETSQLLQFQPFSSTVHPEFWHAFTSLKINKLQLSDQDVPLIAHYSVGRSVLDRRSARTGSEGKNSTEGEWIHLPPSITLDGQSFVESHDDADLPDSTATGTNQIRVASRGYLKNFNTVDAFKAADKRKAFDDLAGEVSEAPQTAVAAALKPTGERDG